MGLRINLGMDAAISKLLETSGIWGPIIIFFGWYILAKDKSIKSLQKELSSVQEARIKDAKAVVTELMELNDKWVAALNSNTAALQEMRTVLAVIRNAPPG